MTWSVYLVRTVTGEVGSKLDVVSGSWSIELNKTDSGTIKAKKRDLLKRGRDWWTPHVGGVLFTFTDTSGAERPITGGVITGWSNETATELTLDWSGIRWVFENRVIDHDLSFKGLSLGTIAWLLVQDAMDSKPSGGLPVGHGSPSETSADNADHQRTYEGWNLSNNGYGKRLTELSEVINGPDVMFRPAWVDEDHTKVQWAMVHGTEASPRISQDWTPDFDTTVEQAEVTGMKLVSQAKHVVNRVWYTGAGEGADVARVSVQDLSSLQYWYPFTEKVLTDSDQAKTEPLLAKARAELAASRSMLDQLTMSFRASAKKHPLGSFNVGEMANVWLSGWVSVPDGLHPMRMIAMSGDLSETVDLDFQQDSWD